MTLRELANEIAFDINKAHDREEFITKFEEHLMVVAAHADALGQTKLTQAIDRYRKHFREWIDYKLPIEDMVAFYDADEEIKSFICEHKYTVEEDDYIDEDI